MLGRLAPFPGPRETPLMPRRPSPGVTARAASSRNPTFSSPAAAPARLRKCGLFAGTGAHEAGSAEHSGRCDGNSSAGGPLRTGRPTHASLARSRFSRPPPPASRPKSRQRRRGFGSIGPEGIQPASPRAAHQVGSILFTRTRRCCNIWGPPMDGLGPGLRLCPDY